MLPYRPQALPGCRAGLLVFLLSLFAGPVSAQLAEDLIGRLDALALARLAVVQAQMPTPPRPFTTDGCSGGLSSGWQYLAKLFPALGRRFGQRPPWEACCVSHDRAYWAGRAERGYALRKQADSTLRQCVIDLGPERAPQLAREYGLEEDEVLAAWRVAAESMYWAVRTGGQACSPFPWRWGYGWPACPLTLPATTANPEWSHFPSPSP